MTPTELKTLRKELRLTQSELAEKLGVTVHAVRKWEQGQRAIKGPALKILREMKK